MLFASLYKLSTVCYDNIMFVVSSVKLSNSSFVFVVIFIKQLITIKNINGSNTIPWSTPHHMTQTRYRHSQMLYFSGSQPLHLSGALRVPRAHFRGTTAHTRIQKKTGFSAYIATKIKHQNRLNAEHDHFCIQLSQIEPDIVELCQG